MTFRIAVFFLAIAWCAVAQSAVMTSEFLAEPAAEGWTLVALSCEATTWLGSGTWNQQLEEKTCPGKIDETEAYSQSAASFNGHPTWFFEYRVFTTGDRAEIPGVAPTSLATGNSWGILYHSTVASDQVKFLRDAQLPVLFFDLRPGIFHTIRLELRNDEPPTYRWYADGELLDSGLAEGPYPAKNPTVSWLGRSWHLPTYNEWDYIRFGDIPIDASADFNSDGAVDDFDHFYIEECIERSASGESASPSCEWADMNGDDTVNCTDWQIIRDEYWTGPGSAPALPACGAGIPTTSEWGVVAMAMALTAGATLLFHRRELHT